MWQSLTKIWPKCITVGMFLLPFGASILFYQVEWGRGFTNPYASFYIFAFEFFLCIGTLLFLAKRPHQKTHPDIKRLLILLTAITLLSFALSPHPDALFKGLLFMKFIWGILLFLALIQGGIKSSIKQAFILGMTLQSLIAIAQFISQSSLGLSILGEPSFNEQTAHVAKWGFASWEWIRAYGTLPHPNILAGLLALSLTLLLYKNPLPKQWSHVFFVLQIIALMLTFSRSAWLAMGVIGMIFLYKKFKHSKITAGGLSLVLVGLILMRSENLFQDAALWERWEGYSTAWELFQMQPFGVGWHHYTLFMDQVAETVLNPWTYQPVHNIFVLMANEWGILAILLLFSLSPLLKKIWDTSQNKKYTLSLLALLLILGGLDHYLFSLDVGHYALIFISALLYEGSTVSQNSA